MLTDNQFSSWAARAGLTLMQTEKLRRIRTDGPAREVVGSRSMRGLFPSRKMQRSIQFESRTGEFSACILFETDYNILEFWDQPVVIKIQYEVEGRPAAHNHIPDYLVIRQNSAAFVEVKPLAALQKSISKTKGRFELDGGQWRCPSGEEFAKTHFGIGYEVFVPEHLPQTLTQNLIFLRSYARPAA